MTNTTIFTTGYNLSRSINATSLLDYFINANEITNYWLGNMILIAIFAIALLSLMSKGYDIKRAGAASSFITTLLAILFYIAGIVTNSLALIIPISVTALSFIFLYIKPPAY